MPSVRLEPRRTHGSFAVKASGAEPVATLPISNIEALKVVADSQRHRILTALIECELTPRALAQSLGIGRTRLYYHLNLLEENGFIQVVGEQVVSGIVERTYRAKARRFRVDRALLSAGASEREISAAQAAILEQAAEDLRSGLTRGSARRDDAVFVARRFLRLHEEGRRDLRVRLEAIFQELESVESDRQDEVEEIELVIGLFATEREAE